MTQILIAEPAVIVSLDSIERRICVQNPDLAAARLRIQEALGRKIQSGRLTNPNLDTSIEQNPRSRDARVEIGISQKFPLTNRLQLEKDVSLTNVKASEAEVLEVERLIISKAREVLVKVMTTRQRRELIREQAAVSLRFAESLSDVAAKGEGSILDVGQAKLEITSLNIEIRQLNASETALLGELKPLLGMRPSEMLSISGSLPNPELAPVTVDPSMRPDYQAAKLNAQAAAQGEALEKARRYSDVEAGFYAAAEREDDAPIGYENEAFLGLRFTVALPFWNKNEGTIHEAKAKKERMDKEATALGRTIQLEVRAAHNEMQEWMRLIDEIDSTFLPLATEQTKLAEVSFRNGQGLIQPIFRSQEKLLQLRMTRLDALSAFHLARVRYEATRGNN